MAFRSNRFLTGLHSRIAGGYGTIIPRQQSRGSTAIDCALNGEDMSQNKFAGGVATALAMVTAAGAASLALGVSRQRDEEVNALQKQLLRWGGEDPEDAQREVLVAAATGAALGILTYQGITLLGKYLIEREHEDI